MNDDTWLGKNSLRFWYYRYKDSSYYSLSIISLTIIVCIILIVQIIIPQVQSWFSIRDEVIATRERISVLRDNSNFMNNLDRSLLNSQIQIASSALPPEKKFDTILNAISDSALQSSVSLGDFSFHVGNISSSSGQIVDSSQKGLSGIEITLVVASNIDGAKKFLSKVKEKLPLSEVIQVEGGLQSTTITLRFFQKPYPKIVYHDTQPISPVTGANTQLLQRLSSWQVQAPSQSVSLPSGSSSDKVPLF
jgi:hypothetical protein